MYVLSQWKSIDLVLTNLRISPPPGPSIPDGDGPRQQSDSALIKIEPLVDHLFPDQQLQDPKL